MAAAARPRTTGVTRRTVRGALAAAMLGLGTAVAAAEAAEDADHEALRALREVYERAVNENNVELLRPHLDPDFSAVTSTNQAVSGFEGFKAYWNEYWGHVPVGGTGPRYTAKLAPERSLVYGDLAIGGGTSHDTIRTADGREYALAARWTVVFHKRAGKWKILRLHASIDPFSNPLVGQGAQRLALKAALGALGVGMLVGWLAGWVFARRGRG